MRAYPDAPEGSARARVLLFSNADSSSARANGTIRVSYDDGFTWNDGTVFESGEMAYATLHPLGDGTWGLLYESGGYKNIEFMRVDASYLGLTDPGEESTPDPTRSPRRIRPPTRSLRSPLRTGSTPEMDGSGSWKTLATRRTRRS